MVSSNAADFNRNESSSLRAAVSGGLNTASSDLLTPLEQSPDLNNVQVDFDMMARKRRGYKTLFNRNQTAANQHSYLRGTFAIPLQMASGRPVLFTREESRLICHVRQDGGLWTTTTTFGNVFGSASVNDQFDYVIQNDTLYSRIILVSGNSVPIQVATVSSSFRYTHAGGTSWTFTEQLIGFANVTGNPTLLVMLVNGLVETVSAVTTTVSGLSVTSMAVTSSNSYSAATYDIELMYVSWQWWAEALQLKGSQFVQTIVQGTSTKTIAVPSVLLQGIEPYSGGLPPLRAFQTTNYDAIFSRVNPPTTSTQYSYSNGADSDGTTPVSPAPFYLAFGASPAAVRNVTIVRGYFMPFYGGGVSQIGGAVQVIPYYNANVGVRSTVLPPTEGGAGTGSAGLGFHFRVRNTYGVSTGTTSTRVPRYITLDATATASGGLAQVSGEELYHIIDVINTETVAAGYLGSNAAQGSISNEAKNYAPEYPPIPKHTYGFPVAGLSWFADYRRGSFPRCIGTFQGRLVLGGFRDQPMRLAFSNSYDSDAPGYFCNNFDVVYSVPSVVSPFDVNLPGAPNDIITNLVEFNDSLFVFTRYRTFRVHNNGELVDYSNVKYSLVAELGSNNPRSATVTEDYPVFLSPSGVYGLVADDSSAGYGVQELSVSVRNLIQENNKTLPYVGFVLYDPGRSELYVGLSDNTSLDRTGQLLVYNTRLNSWYSYTSMGGASFQVYWGACLWDNSVNNPTAFPSIIFTAPYKYNDDDWMHFIEMNQDSTPVDLHQRWVYASTPFTTALPALQVTFTTVNNVKEYDPSSVALFKEKAFKLSPIRDLQDCVVTLNAVTLTFGTDYIKTDRGTILLTNNPGAGVSLVVESRMSYEGTLYHPVALMSQAGKIFTPGTYTVDISGDFYRITGVTPTPSVNDIFFIGYCFPSWYVTPTFNRGTLNVKRVKQYVGYYHNEVSDIWTINDAYPAASNVGTRKVPLNVNVAVVFSNEYEGLLQTELYNDQFPSTYPNQQLKNYSRIVVPIVGNGYNIQVIHHNNTPSTFKLAGYEIIAVAKAGKGYSKSEEKIN